MGFLATHGSSGAVIAASPEMLRIFGFDRSKEYRRAKCFEQRVHPMTFAPFCETADKARSQKSADYEADYRIYSSR